MTTGPWAVEAVTTASFRSGDTEPSASSWGMPSFSATAATAQGWSPESRPGWNPSARRRATAAGASSRTSSPSTAAARTMPSTATSTTVRPSALQASARA
jgi:hypothetical protein